MESMQISDVIFTGRVDVRQYLGRMDFTILTSISEGMPLTILESYAAKKPVIATDVGNCKGLIYGESDNFGAAGILTHIMNVSEITQAIVKLAKSPELRYEMGEVGYKRVEKSYRIEQMKETYKGIYQELGSLYGSNWTEEKFEIKRS